LNPEQPLTSSVLFWCLLWITATALVPELSELVALGRPELIYRSHNFELAWGLYHIVPGLAGVIIALLIRKRAPIVAALTVVVLATEIAFAVLDHRRNGFLGGGEGRISLIAYLAVMLATGGVFAVAWRYFASDRARPTYE
jgi:hypothetical protein